MFFINKFTKHGSHSDTIVEHLLVDNNAHSYDPKLILAGSSALAMLESTIISNDHDLFVLDEGILENLDKQLNSFGYYVTKVTSYAKTYEHSLLKPIQVIIADGKTPEQVLSVFDIDICMVGYDGRYVYSSSSIKSAIQNKRVTLNDKLPSPKYTLSRLLKYSSRGYDIKQALYKLLDIVAEKAVNGTLPNESGDYDEVVLEMLGQVTTEKDLF